MLVAKLFEIDVNRGDVWHEKIHTMEDEFGIILWGEVLHEHIMVRILLA
jgi:hypothetical protein